MGKPKLTTELIKEISRYIQGGMTNKDACILCGISETALYGWIKKSNKGGLFVELVTSIKKAEAGFKAYHLQSIAKAGTKTWQASAWLLERKYRKEFGRYAVQEGGGEGFEDLQPLADALKDN